MINVNEILKGSILCHEGRAKKVIAIGDYIQFEGFKVWIGGSMINGEPISEKWVVDFGFTKCPDDHICTNGKMSINLYNWTFKLTNNDTMYEHVHQLQLLHYAITLTHLKVPKLPK